MPKIKVWAATNMIGSNVSRVIEIDNNFWDEATPEERDEAVAEALFEMIEWDYEVVDE